MNNIEQLVSLCKSYKAGKWTSQLLKGEGSNRKYYRLTHEDSETTVIGVAGESKEENHAFITITNTFNAKNLPVPTLLGVSEDEMFYIQEDLGDDSLFECIENGRNTGNWTPNEIAILKKTLCMLPHIQFIGAEDLDFSVCYPQENMDKRAIMWDLNYFKYCFLKLKVSSFSEPKLENEFEQLTKDLLRTPSITFMLRDCQSRNVMIKEGEPYFIDYQGGRRGPFLYDVASFLWQAKARIPADLKKELAAAYYEELNKYIRLPKEEFDRQLLQMAFFRTLQVLGAYGFRGLVERKPHFLESIDPALRNLRDLLNKGIADSYPYLKELMEEIVKGVPEEDLAFEAIKKAAKGTNKDKSKLTVTVMSFSYKKGIPTDEANGGGYAFDCRAVHNPGKYEQYKPLTGRDQPVIDFLEKDGEITQFLEHVYALADAHVERYISRGFSSLMLCFGCTGGQHRSVYSAQHTAEHIAMKFGVKVKLIHREQGIEEEL